jgi:acetoin utilization deacetylase AcuC-like enzyme
LKFGVIYTPVFLEHRPEEYHPENPERLERAVAVLKEVGLWENVIEPQAVPEEELLKVHEQEYVDFIKRRSGVFSFIDPDTYVSGGTFKAALHAFGAVKKAVELALEEKGLYLALVRPPGHHAGKRGRAFNAPTLGFCIFNNAAYGAKLLEEIRGRALVIDFDAHHGNGTQEILWDDPNAVHIDLHERDIYPGSGYEAETGGKGALGTKVNIPMPHRSGDDDFIYAWDEIVVPIVEAIKPEAIVVSAGFDGFIGENLTTLRLTELFYAHAGSTLSDYPLVVVFEGGYGPGIERGLPAFLNGYLKRSEVEVPLRPSHGALEVVKTLKDILGEWWSL